MTPGGRHLRTGLVGGRVAPVTGAAFGMGPAAAPVACAVSAFGRLDTAFDKAVIQAPPCDAADESAEAFDRVNQRAAHHASKHGVIGLTKSAAVEYGAGFVIGVALPVNDGYTSP